GKLRGIGVRHGRRSSKPAPPLGGLAAQQVLFESLAAQKLAALRALEALGRATMTLDLLLRHDRLSVESDRQDILAPPRVLRQNRTGWRAAQARPLHAPPGPPPSRSPPGGRRRFTAP